MSEDIVTWLRAVLDIDEWSAAKLGDLHDWSLADIAAKRAIIDRYQAFADLKRHEIIGNPDAVVGIRMQLFSIVKTLASAYSDRPGWQETWRP